MSILYIPRYIYSDEVKFQSIEEAGEVLYVAKKYLVQPLIMECIFYLVQNTWIKTLWDILYIAEGLDEEELFMSCIKVTCNIVVINGFPFRFRQIHYYLQRANDKCFFLESRILSLKS